MSNQSPEPNRADTSEGLTTGESRLAEVTARLNELLERGEISPEAYAEYAAVADAARELATDVAAQREPANIQEAENPHV
jgi:hypothetical protein